MNREIKFRGKRVDNDKWVEGFLVLQGTTNRVILSYIIPIVSYNQDGFIGRFEKVYTKTLGQYTGIKDRNGKEIYEDDILRTINHFEGEQPFYLYHIVKFIDNYNGWMAIHKDSKNNESGNGNLQLWVYLKNIKDFEVIGNIYDNPELTK